MNFESGQIWRTRGDWRARIVAVINAQSPVVAVHMAPMEEFDEVIPHYSDGTIFNDRQSDWDLVDLVSVGS